MYIFGDKFTLLLLGCGNSVCGGPSWYVVSDSLTDHSYSIFASFLVNFLFFFSFINAILVYVCQFSAIKLKEINKFQKSALVCFPKELTRYTSVVDTLPYAFTACVSRKPRNFSGLFRAR